MLSLWLMVLSVPFATVWQALEKIEGDPEKYLIPLEHGLLGVLGRTEEMSEKPSVEKPLSAGDQIADTAMKVVGVAGVATAPNESDRVQIATAMMTKQTKTQEQQPSQSESQLEPTTTVEGQGHSLAFQLVQAAADVATDVEHAIHPQS